MNFYHCIKLPDGSVTPGTRNDDFWNVSLLPERMDGLSVLDIGAYDGCYSFEAEKRGAASVTAIDIWGRRLGYWFGELDAPSREAFDYCHKLFNSKVVARNQSVYELEDDRLYDWVIFSQVLYHLEDPLLALKNVARAAKDKIAFEGLSSFSSNDCSMRYISDEAVCNDRTNIWWPTWNCLNKMFKHVGLKVDTYKADPGGRVAAILSKL